MSEKYAAWVATAYSKDRAAFVNDEDFFVHLEGTVVCRLSAVAVPA